MEEGKQRKEGRQWLNSGRRNVGSAGRLRLSMITTKIHMIGETDSLTGAKSVAEQKQRNGKSGTLPIFLIGERAIRIT